MDLCSFVSKLEMVSYQAKLGFAEASMYVSHGDVPVSGLLGVSAPTLWTAQLLREHHPL